MPRFLDNESWVEASDGKRPKLEQWQALKTELLDTFAESRTEHRAAIAEASAFIKDYGPVRDALVIDESDIPQLKGIMDQHNFLFDVQANAGNWGFYLGELGIAVANKSNVWRNFDGSDCLPSVLVHELAHGTSEEGACAGDMDYLPRVGFLDRENETRGNFLEEGFADLVRSRFLSKKVGNAGETKKDFNKIVPFPLKYAYLNRQGVLTLGGLSCAGYGMELVAAREPQLISALKHSRRDDKKIDEVKGVINRIRPGLFESLHDLKTDSADYEAGFRLICEALDI